MADEPTISDMQSSIADVQSSIADVLKAIGGLPTHSDLEITVVGAIRQSEDNLRIEMAAMEARLMKQMNEIRQDYADFRTETRASAGRFEGRVWEDVQNVKTTLRDEFEQKLKRAA